MNLSRLCEAFSDRLVIYLECPCCGEEGAASDGEGCFYDGQS